MRVGGTEYSLREAAGAFGDLGTLIPFLAGCIAVARIDPAGVLIAFGLFRILAGMAFRTPIPIQPMKAIGTAAISHPGTITPRAVWASGLFTGVLWLLVGVSGAVGWIARITQPGQRLHDGRHRPRCRTQRGSVSRPAVVERSSNFTLHQSARPRRSLAAGERARSSHCPYAGASRSQARGRTWNPTEGRGTAVRSRRRAQPGHPDGGGAGSQGGKHLRVDATTGAATASTRRCCRASRCRCRHPRVDAGIWR